MPSREDEFIQEEPDQPRRKPRASREDELVTSNRPDSSGPRRKPRREEAEEDAPPKKKSNTLLMVLLIFGGVGLMGFCLCCGVGGYFGYEFQQSVTETKRVSNDLKLIGLAFHNHHDTLMYFPTNYTSKDGKPLLSWRVAALPFLEEGALFKQFKLDEPWDGPNNRKLIERCPKIYLSRRHKDPSLTCYCGYSGPHTIFDPQFPKIRIAQIPDGLSNTIFVVEAENPVTWSKPEDLPFDPKGGPLPPLHYRASKTAVLMGDASVRLLPPTVPDQTMRFLIMRDDGNAIPDW